MTTTAEDRSATRPSLGAFHSAADGDRLPLRLRREIALSAPRFNDVGFLPLAIVPTYHVSQA
jgi:hypothetical protein